MWISKKSHAIWCMERKCKLKNHLPLKFINPSSLNKSRIQSLSLKNWFKKLMNFSSSSNTIHCFWFGHFHWLGWESLNREPGNHLGIESLINLISSSIWILLFNIYSHSTSFYKCIGNHTYDNLYHTIYEHFIFNI